jgi:hypothetical protein
MVLIVAYFYDLKLNQAQVFLLLYCANFDFKKTYIGYPPLKYITTEQIFTYLLC